MQKCIISILLFSTSVAAQPCRIIKDINSNNLGPSTIVYANLLTAAGNRLFFSGAECTQSPEVYAVDSATDSIYLPKNVWQEKKTFWCGTDPVYIYEKPSNLTAVGNLVFYIINHDDYGRELWRSDGSLDGTLLMKDIYPGPTSSEPDHLTSFNGKIWFVASDALHGRELWYSDGTSANTKMLDDFLPGSPGAIESPLASSADYLYFIARLSDQAYWLLRTDGTSAGIDTITPITIPSDVDKKPMSLQVLDNRVFWVLRSNDTNTADMYTLDLQTMQWLLLKSFYSPYESPAHTPSGITQAGGKMFFAANTVSAGRELWITDGSPGGTKMILDLAPGPVGSYPDHIVSFLDTLYFSAVIGSEKKLCKSDGTTDGTFALSISGSTFSGVEHLNVWDGYIWFTSSTYNREIWRSDGTGYGTTAVMSGNGFTNIDDIEIFNNAIYFAGHANGNSIWKFSGLPGSQPQRLKGNEPSKSASNSSQFVKIEDRGYFWATDENSNREIWSSNGATVETFTISNLPNFSSINENTSLFAINDSLLIFNSSLGSTGNELWRSDGAVNNQSLIIDLNPGSVDGISSFGSSDGKFVFFIGKSGVQSGLYRTDGTADGTILLKAGITDIHHKVTTGGITYIKVYHQGATWLLRTDGTAQGTELVVQIVPIQYAADDLVVFNDIPFFIKQNDDNSWGLWETDGTVSNTKMVTQLSSSGSYKPYGLTAGTHNMYFVVRDGQGSNKLQISDGILSVATTVVDLGLSGAVIHDIMEFGDKVLINYQDSTSGAELWISDGTSDGTYLLKDILPGTASSYPLLFLSTDSLFYFTAFTEEFGRELWQTDGTIEGTIMVQDVCKGPCSSTPVNLFALSQDKLFFKAYSLEWGIEPWVYDPYNTTSALPRPEMCRVKKFCIYPNPAFNNVINLTWDSSINPALVELIDINGRLCASQVLEKQSAPYEISLSELNIGPYFMKISDQNGQILGSDILIIQKN